MREMKRKPTHPGRILKEDYLEPLSMTITEMSSILGVSRKTLSKITNERGSVTPDMALRLSRAFDTTPDLWMNLRILICGKHHMRQRHGKVSSNCRQT
jgi:addiction module HigA family antidote